jgi:hypothetical protein
MDYAMPRAEDIPMMAVGDHPVPAKSNPLGTKGCGEAGCAGSLSTIVNAVVDALSEYGITHIDMPLTPERVWRAIRMRRRRRRKPFARRDARLKVTPYPLHVIARLDRGHPRRDSTRRPRRTGCPASRGMTKFAVSGMPNRYACDNYAAACSRGW